MSFDLFQLMKTFFPRSSSGAAITDAVIPNREQLNAGNSFCKGKLRRLTQICSRHGDPECCWGFVVFFVLFFFTVGLNLKSAL